MDKQYKLSLHIFRRDLRLVDNTALLAALKSSASVIPCFIFDKRQIEDNAYRSDNCIQFMVTSLLELNQDLAQIHSRLYFFYGHAEDIVAELIAKSGLQAVFINRDYTPFARNRDRALEKICRVHNVDFHCYADALLHEPEQIAKADGKPYTIFTHFYRRAREFAVPLPCKNNYDNYYRETIPFMDTQTLTKLRKCKNPNLAVKGGRQEAIALVKRIKNLQDYAAIRNLPAVEGTTKLSAHNKFGTLSIRELHAAISKYAGTGHQLLAELYWRDFFTHIAFHFPHVFGSAFNEKFVAIEWSNDAAHFRAWCEGLSGFPIVDAGMRELNTTGYMHNRVRMITASFLTKDLHIDWRWGEKYYAQRLVDYDPAVNNGNWQWAASTGCDAQPYFRIFNPWLQQQKFDPECAYIKRWIPELSAVPSKTIHELYKHTTRLMTNYPLPIVDHAVESQRAKRMYKIHL